MKLTDPQKITVMCTCLDKCWFIVNTTLFNHFVPLANACDAIKVGKTAMKKNHAKKKL